MDFLHNLWGYSLKNAKTEAAELQKMMDKEGKERSLPHGIGGIIPKNFVSKNII